MSQRLIPFALSIAAGTALVAGLSGCSLLPQPSPSPSGSSFPVTAPSSAAPPTSTTTTSSAPTQSTPTAAPTASANGCAPNSATMPAGAKSRLVGDVDGDGKKDTEWISDSPTLRFGVSTASGATFSYPLSSASPAAREGFVTRLNDHRVVSLVDDNRSAYVHFLVDCKWLTPKNPQGTPYTYDFNLFAGNGSGVGCSRGFVVGLKPKKTSTGYEILATELYLNATGSTGSNGPTSVLYSNLSTSDPRYKAAFTISCGAVTVANAGVTVG